VTTSDGFGSLGTSSAHTRPRRRPDRAARQPCETSWRPWALVPAITHEL